MPDFFCFSRLSRSTGLLKSCQIFTDKRDQEKITHSLAALLKQRIFGICQGYEDLNDHERLRDDKTPAAGKSSLNRLELGHELDEKLKNRYRKITWDARRIEELLCQLFLDSFEETPETLILDFDATVIPIHGEQQR